MYSLRLAPGLGEQLGGNKTKKASEAPWRGEGHTVESIWGRFSLLGLWRCPRAAATMMIPEALAASVPALAEAQAAEPPRATPAGLAAVHRVRLARATTDLCESEELG
jgi:hypothetical protein